MELPETIEDMVDAAEWKIRKKLVNSCNTVKNYFLAESALF